MRETKKRSIAKTISYRIGCAALTLTVIYLISKDIGFAGAITIAQQIAVTIFYYLHERIWSRKEWGKGEKLEK